MNPLPQMVEALNSTECFVSPNIQTIAWAEVLENLKLPFKKNCNSSHCIPLMRIYKIAKCMRMFMWLSCIFSVTSTIRLKVDTDIPRNAQRTALIAWFATCDRSYSWWGMATQANVYWSVCVTRRSQRMPRKVCIRLYLRLFLHNITDYFHFQSANSTQRYMPWRGADAG